MVEKWLLVLLIVGCTSLVFLICFPIDFFLYRRRKRLARERKNKLPIYQLRNTPRAEQNHAKINTQHMRDMGREELNDSRRKLDSFKAQVGLAKFFSKLKKKTNTDDPSEQRKELTKSRSENSTEFQILTTSPDVMADTVDVSKLSDTESSTDDTVKHVSVRKAVMRSDNESINAETIHTEHSLGMKLPSVSTAWGENEELVDHESKHLNYGALEPYGSVLQSRPPPYLQEEKCFTIPVNKRYKVVRTDHGESCTDFDVFCDERASDNVADGVERYKSATPAIGSNNGNLEQFIEHHEPLRVNRRERFRSCEAALFEKFDSSCSDISSRHPRDKVLEHSFSDQLISYCPNTIRTNYSKAKKRNIVSPSSEPPKCFSEQFDEEENDSSSINQLRQEYLTSKESSIPIDVSKKSRKKKYRKKRQASESMPDLTSNKEKF